MRLPWAESAWLDRGHGGLFADSALHASRPAARIDAPSATDRARAERRLKSPSGATCRMAHQSVTSYGRSPESPLIMTLITLQIVNTAPSPYRIAYPRGSVSLYRQEPARLLTSCSSCRLVILAGVLSVSNRGHLAAYLRLSRQAPAGVDR